VSGICLVIQQRWPYGRRFLWPRLYLRRHQQTNCNSDAKMLCNLCQSIEFQPLSDLKLTRSQSQVISAIPDLQDPFFVSTSWFYIHQPSLAAAKFSSNQGCSFCTMLCDGLVQYRDLFGGRVKTANWSPGPSSPIILSITHSSSSWQEGSHRAIIVRCGDRKTSCTLTGLPRKLPPFSQTSQFWEAKNRIERKLGNSLAR